MFALSLHDHPSLADCAASDIPDEALSVVVMDGSAMMTDEEYFDRSFSYEATMEFVEIGSCSHEPFLMDGEDMHLIGRPSLLCLGCKANDSGSLVNKGTVLLIDASALSGEFSLRTIL